jgi:beta-N-acetylhexosaminidase
MRVAEDLERCALRVLLPSFPGTVADRDALGLVASGLGGICLFGSNTAAGPDAVSALAASVHTESANAIVAIDEEGGDVTRIHATTGSPFLGAGALGAVDDLDLTRETARAVGEELAGLGLDLTFGPDADVNSNPDNPVIGIRSFGDTSDRVAAHVAAWVGGLQAAGPAACAKHFPGHGDTHQDSHLGLPEIDVPLDLLERRELVPFRAAVAAGVEAVMTSHIVVRALDPGPDPAPATLSGPVLSLLRTTLGFEGTIVSDALDMAGASAGRGIPRAAVRSLVAGADLLCIGPDKDVELVRAVQREIVAAVRSGELTPERLIEAAAQVDRLASRPRSAPHRVETSPEVRAAQLRGARTAVRVEGRLPDLGVARVVSIETEPNIAVGPVPWGLPADLSIGPDAGPDSRPDAGPDSWGDLVLADGDPLIVQVREAHRHPGVRALLERLISAGRTVVVLEWGWPGDLGLPGLPRVIAHGSSLPSVAAVSEVLQTAGWKAGS